MMIPVCDVRDAAQAHINCMKGDSYGERYIITGSTIWFEDLSTILEEKYGKYGYMFPKKPISGFVLKLCAFFDKSLRVIKDMYGKEMIFSREKAKRAQIMYEYKAIEKTLIDMMDNFVKKGFVDDYISDFNETEESGDKAEGEKQLITKSDEEEEVEGNGKKIDAVFDEEGAQNIFESYVPELEKGGIEGDIVVSSN